MDNTKAPFKKPRQETKKACSEEKDQESAVLRALGHLERKLELILEVLVDHPGYELEDGEESQDDEENSSTSM